jgi:hypothetical protein
MKRGLIAAALAFLALAAPAAAGLPRAGTLVPGRSLGGVSLGEPASSVRAALGSFYGTCRGCRSETWYFTYRPFGKHGLAVELARGRVSGVYTLWQPPGWSASNGLRLGASPLQVHEQAGTLGTIACPGYEARYADSAGARTVYYLFRGHLWGFGLFRRGAAPCL